jgi:H+/Cl- antiporter ClcA
MATEAAVLPASAGLSDTDHEMSGRLTQAVDAFARPGVAAYALVIVATGIGAGLGGMALALLLHGLQHLAYGYGLDALIGRESFLQGVSAAAPWRRVAVLLVCGAIAGGGWWAIYRHGPRLVSIRKAVEPGAPPMPGLATTGHAVLQIVTVALGSPLGREVAPREIGSLVAGWAARRARLPDEDVRIMIACGAGAGLAAVYNVPLAGALFTLEVLLRSSRITAVVPAIATSWIAAVVAWAGLGDETMYRFAPQSISAALVAWALLAGPVLGAAARHYIRIAAWARARAPHDARMIPWCIAVFLGIGLASIWFPQLLGNGRGPTQLDFDGDVPLRLAIVLIVLKVASTTFSLRAGAEGGLLTPGLTIGGFIAVILGSLWNMALAGVTQPMPLGAYAIVGATGFLAVSMAMPLTAIVLILEFTHVGHDFLIPIMAATTSALAADFAMTKRAAVKR